MAPRKKTGARGSTIVRGRGAARTRVTKAQAGPKRPAKTAATQVQHKASAAGAGAGTPGSKATHADRVDVAPGHMSAGTRTCSVLPGTSNRRMLRPRANEESEADGRMSSSGTAAGKNKTRGSGAPTRGGKAKAAAPARSILKKTVAAYGGESIALGVMLSKASTRGTRRGVPKAQAPRRRLETISEADENAASTTHATTQHAEQPTRPGATDAGVAKHGTGERDVSPSDNLTELARTPDPPRPSSGHGKSVRWASELESLHSHPDTPLRPFGSSALLAAHEEGDPDGYLDDSTPEFLRRLYNRFDDGGRRLPMPEQTVFCGLLFEHEAGQTEFRLPTQRELLYAREVVTPAFLEALLCYEPGK